MFAVCLGSFVLFFQVVIGLALPGSYLEFRIGRLVCPDDDNNKLTRPGLLIQIFSIGSVYLACQLFVIYWLMRFGVESVVLIVGVKLLMDLMAAGIWDRSYWPVLSERLVAAWPAKWSMASQFQFVVALLFGAAATLLMPHGLDNSAVGWLAKFLGNSQLPLDVSQGAISYISLLTIPALVLKGIAPVPTLAAGLKIALSLLLAIIARRMVEAVVAITKTGEAVHVGWCSLALQLIVLSTAMGKYGVYDTGKETVFAMVFFFALAGELILCEAKSRLWYFRVGIVASAAIGFGAMAVPYCVILLATYVVYSWGSINPFRLAASCLLCTFPTLVVSIHAMLDLSWAVSSIVLLVPLIAFGSLMIWGQRFSRDDAFVSSRRGISFAMILFAASILAAAFMMPLKFHIGYFPLDGEATFLNLLMFFNKFDMVGFLGIACFLLSRKFQKGNAGIISLLCFPFFCAVPALVMANFYDALNVPLHPQNVWDWLKDIPRWISGMYLGVFCVIGWLTFQNRRSFRFANVHWLQPSIVAAVFALLLFIDARLIAKRVEHHGLPTYTAVGGHQDPELARFTEWAYFAKSEYRFLNYDNLPLIISDESVAQKWVRDLRMYGIRTVSVSEFHQTQVDEFDKYWCLCSEQELREILDDLGMAFRFRSVPVASVADEQVFKLFDPVLTASRAIPAK